MGGNYSIQALSTVFALAVVGILVRPQLEGLLMNGFHWKEGC